MFVYEKKLQYPVKIARTNPALASIIISQYGGPDFNRLQLKRQPPIGDCLFFTHSSSS